VKLDVKETPVERVASVNETAFKIKATGKAFRALSSNLYKDKILAIVRELSCNAYDAHVAAGKRDIPFDVHLPSSRECWFAVRDYGYALSPTDITSVFTVYFESTKADSNDSIGGFGLGSKTPLSYTDEFTVTSIHKGVKRVYRVYMDESDTPTIAELSCETTAEPDGLEVKLAVSEFDAYLFCNAAKVTFEHFKPHPNVTGNPYREATWGRAAEGYEPLTTTVVFEGDNYRVVERTHGAKARAIMGVVAYPISAAQVGGGEIINEVFNGPLDIDFGIGELDVTMSREELGYSNSAKSILAERAQHIVYDITRRILAKFRSFQNEFEARKFYGDVVSRHTILRSQFPEGKIPFKGQFISSGVFQFDSVDVLPSGSEISLIETVATRKTPRLTTYSKASSEPRGRVFHIAARDEIIFIEDDCAGKYLNFRYKSLIETPGQEKHTIYVMRRMTEEEKQFFKDTFPNAQFIKLSSLDRPTREQSARKKPSVMMLTTRGYSRRGRRSGCMGKYEWEPVIADMDEGGLFVMINGGYPEYNENSIYHFGEMYDLAISLGLLESKTPIFGVSRSLEKKMKFAEHSEWTNMFDYLIEQFHNHMEAKNWPEAIARNRRHKEFHSSDETLDYRRPNADRMLRKASKALNPTHPLVEFFSALDTNTATPTEEPSRMSKMLGIMIPEADSTDLVAKWKAVNFTARYPMAHFVFEAVRREFAYSYNYNKEYDDAVEQLTAYLQFCDKNCPIPASCATVE
jgi:hypothetical protein